MSRPQILSRLGYQVPEAARVRLVIDTDAKNEADDQYAIAHLLLSPTVEVCGISAAHFEGKAGDGGSMERSFAEIQKLLKLMDMEEVPALRGCAGPLAGPEDAPDSEAVRFLIREARKPDPRPLYVGILGAATNVAAALNAAPDIGERLVILWNGGGPYPKGRPEFNVMQDPEAARVLLRSRAEIWQTPQDVYASLEVGLAELAAYVRPCGQVGEYLFRQLVDDNLIEFNPDFLLRTGENWTLGDNTVPAMLLMSRFRGNWHMRPAPALLDDLTYGDDPAGKPIRVYDSIDVRLTLDDLFAKLRLCYGA